MIGHRGQGFKDLYAKISRSFRNAFTKQLVYLSTSSAWGVMEGAIRNLVHKKVLNCMCGAFSDKWLDVPKMRQAGGRAASGLGFAHPREAVDKKLATGESTRSRSSTTKPRWRDVAARGDRRAQEKISRRDVHRGRGQFHDGRPLNFDQLALTAARRTPKGVRLAARTRRCSSRRPAARESRHDQDRGYYFDFVEFQKNAEQSMTPSTPSIPHIYA